jgi:hypothetical protein
MGHLTKDQIAKRLADMDALRDIRALSAIWHAGHGGVNEQGEEVLRSLHSPVATLQHMWCDNGEIGAQLRALVVKFLAEKEAM